VPRNRRGKGTACTSWSADLNIGRGYQISGGGLGQGAPFLVPGWLYLTINHCSDYTAGVPGGSGTSAQLSTGTNDIPGTPWLVNSSDSCVNTWRVWCAED
jgi:hypothetical protein